MRNIQNEKVKFGLREMAVIGMLSAVSVVLGLTGYGFIQLPVAKATILHIPVIIGAILEGPVVGAMIGLIFGLFSILQNITAPSVLSFAFFNPLVSVLPRVLIGITAYYSYKMLTVKNESLKIGIGAIVGTLTNTFGVLTMIYILYAAKYAAAKNISPDLAAKVIYGIALTNGIPESVIAVIVCIPVILAVKRIKR
ncbi:MAG: ECF transporter S component [Clostridia bacterium]|nr:ECF transporter S component [Clostridia bacterium]